MRTAFCLRRDQTPWGYVSSNLSENQIPGFLRDRAGSVLFCAIRVIFGDLG